MKKIIILFALLLATLLTSCGNPNKSTETSQTTLSNTDTNETTVETTQSIDESVSQPNVVSLDSYTALGYEISVGNEIDCDESKMYSGERFGLETITNKENIASKSITLFSRNISTNYKRTIALKERGYEIDEYSYVVGATYAFLSYRNDTDKIIEFDISPVNDINYSSPVNPQSTEAEYIAYAKKVLLEITGQSTEGWNLKIESYHNSHGRTYQFVNYNDTSTVGHYTFTFYKTIGGFERYDKMYVKMTNAGEVFAVNAINSDDAFAPYRDIKINAEKVEEAIWSTFGSIKKNAVQFESIDSAELVLNDDGLWVRAAVSYQTDGGEYGGVIFVIQVAEIENDAAVSSGKVKLTDKETVSAIETTTE